MAQQGEHIARTRERHGTRCRRTSRAGAPHYLAEICFFARYNDVKTKTIVSLFITSLIRTARGREPAAGSAFPCPCILCSATAYEANGAREPSRR